MPLVLTKTAVTLYIIALVASVATTFYVTAEPTNETASVRDTNIVFHDGDVLAELSTSYERVKAVIAWARSGDPERLEESAQGARGLGVVRRIHATRSMRAKTGFLFSIVAEPGQPGPAREKPSVGF